MVDVARQELVDALRSVVSVVEDDNSIPILRQLCFRDGMICGSNGVLSIVTASPIKADCCVDGRALLAIHGKLSAATVEWSFEKDRLLVKSGRHKSEFLTSPAAAYPNYLPSGTTTLCGNPEGLADAIKIALSVTSDSTEAHLNAIGVTGQHVYGIDRVQCVRTSIAEAFSASVILPRAAAKVLVGRGDPKKVLLTTGGASIVLLYSGTVAVCRLAQAKMPFGAADNFFANYGNEIVPLNSDVSQAVSRVAAMSDNGIELACRSGVLAISAVRESAGRAEEQVDLIAADFACKVDPQRLLKAMSLFDCLDTSIVRSTGQALTFGNSKSRYAMGTMT